MSSLRSVHEAPAKQEEKRNNIERDENSYFIDRDTQGGVEINDGDGLFGRVGLDGHGEGVVGVIDGHADDWIGDGPGHFDEFVVDLRDHLYEAVNQYAVYLLVDELPLLVGVVDVVQHELSAYSKIYYTDRVPITV